ncbi:MAG: helicase [Candidatus Riflebacteria bacterium HGW-Riflebacteria-1]|jgi:SNF2 family DNA or RNA helicase|nr:MAG: helicase [Candidatus Riflebacteria bacterium HGW-Riflebacteria-1]
MKLKKPENIAPYTECKKKFNALAESDQLMVEVLALFYTKIDAADLARVLRLLFANTGNNYNFNIQVVHNIFGGLARKGFASVESDVISCREHYIDIACRSAVLRKHILPIFSAIQGFFKSASFATGSTDLTRYYSQTRLDRLEFFSGRMTFLPEARFPLGGVTEAEALKGMPIFRAAVVPFEADWFDCLPVLCQVSIFKTAQRFSQVFFYGFPELIEYFSERRWLKSEAFWRFGALPMAEYQLMRGDLDRARIYAELSQQPEAGGIIATVDYLRGDSAGALTVFNNTVKATRKAHGRNGGCFDSIADFFCLVALLDENSAAGLKKAEDVLLSVSRQSSVNYSAHGLMSNLFKFRCGARPPFVSIDDAVGNNFTPLHLWLTVLAYCWMNGVDESLLPALEQISSVAGRAGFRLPHCEALLLKQKLADTLTATERKALSEWSKEGCRQLAGLLEVRPQWQIVLDSLNNVLVPEADIEQPDRLLTWGVSYALSEGNVDYFLIEPREKIRLKSGRWSAGKVLDIGDIDRDRPEFPEHFTGQDQQIVRQFLNCHVKAMGNLDKGFAEALQFLVGHPHIYDIRTRARIQIGAGEPMLILSQPADSFELRFQPEFAGNEIQVIEESDNFLRVYCFSSLQAKTAKLLQANSLFPVAAKSQLAATITALSRKMPVHSSLAGTETLTTVETVLCSKELYLQLQPAGEGLHLKIRVRPFGSDGPAFLPAQGMHEVYAQIDDRKMHTVRNFAQEMQQLHDLAEQVAILTGISSENPDVVFAEADQALELLLQLNDASGVVLEWPVDARIKKVRAVSFDRLRLKVQSSQKWFALEGELNIDDERVLDLQKLLQLYAENGSRFVPIGEGQYLALTEDFRRRLNDIYSFSENLQGQLRVHQLAIPALDEAFADQPNIIFDDRWRKALQRLKTAGAMQFSVPSTLSVDLREYQHEAFQWLCRMDYLEMGACLADDMGLGKTVEALAMLVHKAARGPALVVAPTSVCMNWLEETHRFAPTLNPVIFAQSQRRETLANLGAFDLVICSYGIMQREIEMLSEISWETVILDEAQAIKNMATVRSKAAMALNGNFRVIMTGTPIENHLGELWNLFRFINPGLLGSVDSFNSRFANPIQAQGDKFVQRQLKRLLQPFVLRRTKTQVLQDLPPRTEITLHVELSKDETALYESMRRRAVDKITDSETAAGQKHIMILAELMRLRRLCCNPSLVAPELSIPSSKLSLFESVVDELLENRHKALIFSQFVDHLAIVRNLLDKKGIKYQYLDGSTPTRNRTRAINDFQSGDGDLFLISLKAGGLGLNLTAADYVIHLDPWWNPAVEDQASDRAHRIGQQRPVTIYRLITSRTIEEKIVALHHQKRELADSLLEGTEMAGRVTTAELLALLRETSLA